MRWAKVSDQALRLTILRWAKVSDQALRLGQETFGDQSPSAIKTFGDRNRVQLAAASVTSGKTSPL
jgi:hypothetical protein